MLQIMVPMTLLNGLHMHAAGTRHEMRGKTSERQLHGSPLLAPTRTVLSIVASLPVSTDAGAQSRLGSERERDAVFQSRTNTSHGLWGSVVQYFGKSAF